MSTNNLDNQFFGIGIQNGKTPENLGVLWRSAQNMGASFIFTIGNRYERQACDTYNASNSMPYYHYDSFDDFYNHLPKGARLVGVELTEDAEPMEQFHHPKRCVYLLGAEDHGLSKVALEKAHKVVKFDTTHSLNRSLPKERS